MRNGRAVTVGGAVLGWSLTPAALLVVLVLDEHLRSAGRPDLASLDNDAIVVVLAMFAAGTVGATLAAHQPRNPVGWLFLVLSSGLAFDGVGTDYAALGAIARPGSLPGALEVAAVADAGFILWFVVIAWVLSLTPTGRPYSRGWAAIGWGISACALAWFVLSLIRPAAYERPLTGTENPWQIAPAGSPLVARLDLAATVLSLATALGLVASIVPMFLRYRRGTDDERRQLLWMVLAAGVLPVSVVGVFLAASADSDAGLAISSAGLVTVIPIAAGLSVMRYRLYDVDRIVARAFTYLIVTVLLAASYAAASFALGRILGAWAGQSNTSAFIATLFAVAVAAPPYRRIQSTLDRRFNRRRFDALAVVRRHLQDHRPDVPVEAVLRAAVGDPGLEVGYWVEAQGGWVTADGRDRPPEPDDVEIRRYERPVARIGYDPERVDRSVVQAVAREAAAELHNAGLRAELTQRLVEVQQSRTRIAGAQLAERRALERNLHDGAQQRLLAIALRLRAARGNPDLLDAEVERSIDDLRDSVVELRELANGLHPAALTGGGLAAALDDLAARTPTPVRISAPDERFDPVVEATAWFIACEAVANAVKHADASGIAIAVTVHDGHLWLDISDDGRGGADGAGQGIRGITDRAEAIGGRLRISPGSPGTTIHAELPCAS
jgi:signal transduction histidine kinase